MDPVKAVSDPDEHRVRLERQAQEAAYAQQRAGARIRWGAAAVGGVVVLGSLVLLGTVSRTAPPRQVALSSVPLEPATSPLPTASHPSTQAAASAPTTTMSVTQSPTPTSAKPSAPPPPAVPDARLCVPARMSKLNDDAAGISYSNSWRMSYDRGYGDYFDDVHYTTSDGAKVSYSFTGTGISLFSETFSDEGRMDVYLDDAFQRTVDTTSDTRHAQQAVFSLCGLPPGRHTIRAVKRSGQFMLVDRLDVMP